MLCDAGGDFGLPDEANRLIWDYLEDRISDSDFERLEGILSTSLTARQHFVHQSLLHQELRLLESEFLG